MTLRAGLSQTILVDPLTRDSLDGIGVYTRELGSRLARNPDIEIVPAVTGPRAAAAAAPGTFVFGGRHSLQTLRSIALRADHPDAAAFAAVADVYLVTDLRIPRMRHTPVCAAVHDAIPLRHPEWANPQLRGLKNWLLRRSVAWADRVLVLSQAMVPEIVEHFGVPEQRITVTPLGVGDDWFVAESPERVAAVRARHGLVRDYFLFVGTLQPRKNVERIVDAYARLPAHVRSNFDVVVVGKEGWRAQGTVAMLQRHAGAGVRWLQRVPDAELRALYQGAAAFVFPTLYEGFGLPVVEAFASQVPVVTSTVASLPEVAGDAACLIDPYDVDAIAGALLRVAEDREFAAGLRARGLVRARQFTWDACAAKTAAVLLSMA